MEWFLKQLETRENKLTTEDLECPAAMDLRPEVLCNMKAPPYVGYATENFLMTKPRTLRSMTTIMSEVPSGVQLIKLRPELQGQTKNLYAQTHRIPVVFHDLKGYDGHHIVIVTVIWKTKTDITSCLVPYTKGIFKHPSGSSRDDAATHMIRVRLV